MGHSLVVSAAFPGSSNCSTTSGEMLAMGRALVGLSLPSPASLETKSALELEARMARGYYTFSGLLRVKDTSTPAWSRALFHTWRQ